MTSSTDIPTKVLLVGPLPPPFGGIPAYVRDVYNSDIAGVAFDVFDTALPSWVAPPNREGRTHYQSLRECGVWVAVKMVVYVLLSYPHLLNRILSTRPQIVQVFTCSYWGYWRNWLYVLLARGCGCKTIFHLLNAIDVFYANASDRQRRWIRRSVNSADLCLVQSPGLQKWLEQISSSRVRGIWNGVHLDRISEKKQPPPRLLPPGMPVGITVGGLGRNKGTYDMLDALETLHLQGIEVGWVFVGNGDIQGFTELAVQRGLGDRVLFAGRVEDPDKWRYLHYADLFCLPSYAEGQPIAIIEAMAVGLPVISTSVGSIPEMIDHGGSGIIIGPGDKEALARTIERMALDADLRGRMGRHAQCAARERHGIANMFRCLAAEYTELAAEAEPQEPAVLR